MDNFIKNSEVGSELYRTLYTALKKAQLPGLVLNEHKGYFVAAEAEDRYDKVDVSFALKNGAQVPFQVRAYSKQHWKPGFPIRDSALTNKNEWEKLIEGEMDGVYWAYGSYLFAPSEFGKFKFLKLKVVSGKDLRENAANTIGDRTFDDGNHVTYIADPTSTIYLRNWSH